MISKVAALPSLSGFSQVRYKKTMQKSNNRRNKNKTTNHIYPTTIKTPQISLKN